MGYGVGAGSCGYVAFEKLTAFLREEAEDDLFFLMFAHGYEFDFGTKESSWQKFERICDMAANAPDVVCCSTGEALFSE